MTIKRITGTDAIDFAEANGLTVCMYTSPIEEAREGLSVDEAWEVAAEDHSLIYLDADVVYETQIEIDMLGDAATEDDLPRFATALEGCLGNANWCHDYNIRIVGERIRATIEHRLGSDAPETIEAFVSSVVSEIDW